MSIVPSSDLPGGRRLNFDGPNGLNWGYNVAVNLTGSTVQTALLPGDGYIHLPGGLMGPNGELIIEFLTSNNNSAGAKTFGIFWGNADPGLNTMYNASQTTSTGTLGRIVIRNRNSLVSQIANPSGTNVFYGALSSAPKTSAVDTTLPQLLKVTGTLATGTDNLQMEYISCNFKYRP